MQITKLESEELDMITVYKSEQGKSTELLEHLTRQKQQSNTMA